MYFSIAPLGALSKRERHTIFRIFPKSSDFGDKGQISFTVARGQQNAVSWPDYVPFHMFHWCIANSWHWSFFILKNKAKNIINLSI